MSFFSVFLSSKNRNRTIHTSESSLFNIVFLHYTNHRNYQTQPLDILTSYPDSRNTTMSAIHSMYGSCFCFVFTFGKTRCLVRISDFLSFFADWARVITIGATQSE